jgi:hypothetical protein
LKEEITEQMLAFKEAIRNAWNVYFAKLTSPASTEVQDAYQTLEIAFLRALVLAECGIVTHKATQYRAEVMPWLIVEPDPNVQFIPLSFAARSEETGAASWSRMEPVATEGLEIEFLDFFDWRQYEFNDLRYVRGRLRACPSRVELVGKKVMVEEHHCRFYCESNPSVPPTMHATTHLT